MSDAQPFMNLQNAPMGQGETVLCIEDDPAIRQLMVQLLKRFNYQALMATNATEGLSQWKVYRSAISAVVSDRDLGSDRDGISLLREFGAEKPSAALILMSAALDQGVIETLHRTTRIRCLRKPFSLNEFLPLLRQALDERVL